MQLKELLRISRLENYSIKIEGENYNSHESVLALSLLLIDKDKVYS